MVIFRKKPYKQYFYVAYCTISFKDFPVLRLECLVHDFDQINTSFIAF